jgi:hypothetical protein
MMVRVTVLEFKMVFKFPLESILFSRRHPTFRAADKKEQFQIGEGCG